MSESKINTEPQPNYGQRWALVAGGIATVMAAGGGIASAMAHTDTIASHSAQIAARDIDGGETIADVTRAALRTTAEELVKTADFPPGITAQDKADIIDSSIEASDELIATSGDVSRKKVVVDLDKGFFTTYEVKAHLDSEDKK